MYKYRYAASNYFNNEIAEKSNNLKDELKEALINLVQYNQNKTEYMVDVMISDAPEKRKTESTNTYSDEDAPRETKLFKKNYDKIMTIVEKYYIAQNNFEEFLKLRAFMKNTLQGDKANTDE